MNGKETRGFLTALRTCAGAATGPLEEALAALEGAAPGLRAQASVRGGSFDAAGLRFLGPDARYPAFRAALAAAFGVELDGPARPAPGRPWAAAVWDLKPGRWSSLRLWEAGGRAARLVDLAPGADPVRRAASVRRPSREPFGEPALDRALLAFSALHPLGPLLLEPPGWALALERPPRWPLFARCELASAFAGASSQLALFQLDRRVVELSFDGESLWAHCES